MAVNSQWLAERYQNDPEAILNEIAGFLQGASYLTSVHGQVAVIEVSGLIFPGKLQRLNYDLQAALNNDNIEAIVLDFDTGGGYVTDVNAFAEQIAAAEKPVHGFVGGYAASAGCWLSSQCDTVTVDKTGELGSIGVVQTHFDWSGYDERIGLQEIEIVNTQSPLKRVDVTTKKGQAIIRERLDDLAEVFFESVANGRGITTDDVAALEGNMFVGKTAVEMQLADQTGSLSELIEELNGVTDMSKTLANTKPEEVTAEFVKANCPAAYNEILADGVKQGEASGAKAERDRLAALDAIPTHGSEAAVKIVAEAKADPTKSAGDIALEVLGAIETPAAAPSAEQQLSDDAPAPVGDNPEPASGAEKDAKEEMDLATAAVSNINQRRGASK